MRLINPDFDLEGFWSYLVLSRRRLLLLDYDGTLAPFHPDPSKAVLYPSLSKLLDRLYRQAGTRLIVITGRSVQDLKQLWPFAEPPEIWGSHGGERLYPDGRYIQASMGKAERLVLERAAERLTQSGWKDRLEKKPYSLAIHWRGLPTSVQKQLQGEAADELNEMITHSQMVLAEFDGGLEIRPSTITKADAVKTILSEMDAACPAAYLGDDYTDEDGFKAIKNKGLAVLVRPEYRETNADIWLQPPEELISFFEKWESLIKGSPGNN
jgi:trehalose 6-phosphate phosphatase